MKVAKDRRHIPAIIVDGFFVTAPIATAGHGIRPLLDWALPIIAPHVIICLGMEKFFVA